ncbi:MAG: hypothetical protein ACE5OS_12120 [Anaerolineae bacterium]
MKRTAWIVLVLAVALSSSWIGEPAAAQDTGPTMHVMAGFDGYCRSGDWCPVYVVLSNEGVDVEGELRVAIGGGVGAEPDVYARQVVLPAHSRKAYFLYLPPADSSSYHRPLVQLLDGNKVLSSEQVTVSWLDEGDRLYGVTSGDPSALNFLSDVAPASGRAAVAHLDLETLPPDPLIWEGLDVLVLNDVDTTALGAERRQALETWVAHGGHLIVGGGAGAARTVAGVADPSTGPLLPITVGGTRSVDNLWALGERMGAPVAAGPYAVAEAVLRDGEVLIEQQGLILLARRTCGAGKVDFLAFDAGLNPFATWDDNTRLWEFIVGAVTVGVQEFVVHDEYRARDAINAIPGLEPPSTLQILAFMLVYTLLIGPINYVLLRKLDRRELAWLTIPALIVGFTACAYLTGFQIRGSTAIVHRLAVVHVPVLSSVEGPEGAEVGRVSQLVGLFSPRRTHYDVWVTGVGVREIPGDYYGGPAGQSLHVIEEAEGLTVADLRVDVGGIRPFLTEGYVEVPAVEADLRLGVDTIGGLRLEGTVRNGNVPLKGALLIVGADEQRLGDLEAGEEANIGLLLHGGGGLVAPSSAYAYKDNLPEQILGPGNYWEDPALYRRYQFLQALFPYEGPGLGTGAHLIGWVKGENLLPVEVVDRPFSTVETALYVYDLPVSGVETGATITISPELIERQVEETKGYVDVWSMGFHIDYESEIVLRFTVWPGVAVSRVDELVLDMWGSSYGDTTHPPTVSLWNEESGDWEELDIGWGQHSIPNAGAYVLPPGDVLVRLQTGAEWGAEVESLTIMIKGQR